MSTATLDPLAEVEQLHRQRVESFAALAKRSAANEFIPAVEIDAALQATGKTPADFREMVERIRRRNTLRATMEAKEEHAQEANACGQQIAALDAKLAADIEELQRQHREAVHPLVEQKAAAHQAVSAAEDAVRVLRDGASDELKRRLRQNELAANNYANQTFGLIRDLPGQERQLREALREAEKRRDAEEVRRLTFRLNGVVGKQAEIQSRQNELRDEAHRIVHLMLYTD